MGKIIPAFKSFCMKLLIITAILAFEADIKKMLRKSDIRSYSFQEVKGVSNIGNDAVESNWFADETPETESVLFYAFVKPESIAPLMELALTHNAMQETASHIHIAVLDIERSINLNM
jgi:hypothetical protein